MLPHIEDEGAVVGETPAQRTSDVQLVAKSMRCRMSGKEVEIRILTAVVDQR